MKPPAKTSTVKCPDSFVVRVPKNTHSAMKRLAKHHGRSVNAEYLQAIANGLNGHDRVELLKTIMADRAGPKLADTVLAGVKHINGHDTASGIMKFVIRYEDPLHRQVESAADIIGRPRIFVIICCLTWWLNINAEISALFAAIEGNKLPPLTSHSLGHLTNAFST
ncbi:Arc family DNA-binding protein [Pseudomonas sp. NPDC096950]|uniref:Arc family DNA-binding protein n=1 Tax=Pseudomonas sp. NPDC096950 TaxID=3364485 RepID=UPI00383A610A